MKASHDQSSPELTQRIDLTFTANEQLQANGDPSEDFRVLLNGKEPDGKQVKTEVSVEGDTVTVSLEPGSDVTGNGTKGVYFAVYQAQIEVSSARDDGALEHVVSADSGDNAVLLGQVTGTLPSGLAISEVSSITGSATANTPAQSVFEVTSPAQVRAVTWLSMDGGQTKILKHNHTFSQNDEATCAKDIADVVNNANVGLHAQAQGAQVTVTANDIEDGQVIQPVIVEGFGATGGTYTGTEGM